VGKKRYREGLSFIFLFSCFFGSWLSISQKLKISREVRIVEAVSDKNFGSKNINFNFTDDNSGENLIIVTDQKTYIGLTQAEVFFSVTNTGDKPEQTNLQFYFPEDQGEVKKIEKWTTGVPYEVAVTEYGSKEYFCEDGWETITEEASVDEPIISYQCLSLKMVTFCESLSEDVKNCILNKAEIGSHKETKYKDEWEAVELSNDQIKNRKIIPKKTVSNKFKAKKSTFQNHLINPGQTEYFRAEISFPKASSGEFYIEAIGDKKGYGLLDPWWNSSWLYKKQINLSAGSGAGTNYQIKLLVGESSGSSGANFHLVGHGKSDFGDLRFTDNDESTELDYWIESISGTTPNQTATVWVEVKDNLDSSVVIYAYYGNTGATYNNSTGGNNTFLFFDDFSGDLSKWTKEKELGTISQSGGYVQCGGGITSGTYGHTVLGSSATYTGFQDGIVEFKHYHAANGIGEVSFRGNYASNTGYKGRWDARTGSEQVFLKPPYSGWANIGTAMTKWISASIWYRGKLVIHGSTLELYDNDSLKQSMTDTTYLSAGEISLQNHYGSYTRFDDVRVRKYASTEPSFSSEGNEETPAIISVSVNDGVVAYGMVGTGATNSTLSLGDTQTAQNDGNVTENFQIKTSIATNGTSWGIGQTAGQNVYVHEFSVNSGGNWTKFSAVDTYQNLVSNVGVGESRPFDLQLTVPTTTGDYLQKTIYITILATQQN